MKQLINLRTVIITLIIIGVATLGVYSLYPKVYKGLVYEYADQYNVDPLLVYAIMKVESKYNTNAVSRSGAKGLMQIMNQTGGWGAQQIHLSNYSDETLFKPEVNIHIGCWYIAKLIRQYEGDLTIALAAYNAGTGNVAKWRRNTNYSSNGKTLEIIPFKETRLYVKRVMWHYTVYKFLYRY